MSDEDRAHFIEEAMNVLGSGIDRAKVERVFDRIQKDKAAKKDSWSRVRGARIPRYNTDAVIPGKSRRDAARKAADGLKRVLIALKPVVNDPRLNLSEHAATSKRAKGGREPNLEGLEKLWRHLEIIAQSKLPHPSNFNARMFDTARKAVGLLVAAGKKDWVTTRNREADLLAAMLWGDPEADFQQYLLMIKHNRLS